MRSVPPLGVAGARVGGRAARSPDVDAVAICSSTDTHVDLIVAARGSGQADLLREAGLADAQRGRPCACRRRARRACCCRSASTAASTPRHQAVRDAVAAGHDRRRRTSCGSRAATRSRRRSSTLRASGGLFLDMTIHDFDMARYVTGSEVVEVFARGAARVDPAVAEAGDVDTAVVTLVHEDGVPDRDRQQHGRPSTATTSGWRRSARQGWRRSENPPAHAGVVRTSEGSRGARLPYFFLERYVPSYIARVAGVRRGGGQRRPVARERRRRPRAARDRPRRRRGPPAKGVPCRSPRSADRCERR